MRSARQIVNNIAKYFYNNGNNDHTNDSANKDSDFSDTVSASVHREECIPGVANDAFDKKDKLIFGGVYIILPYIDTPLIVCKYSRSMIVN